MNKLVYVLVLAMWCAIAGAEVNRSGNYKVGDTVEVWINNARMQCTILAINGDQIEVHYGGGRYNKKWVTKADIYDEAREKAKAKSAELRVAFLAENEQKYLRAVQAFVRSVRPSIQTGYGDITDPVAFKGYYDQLGELDAICKAKYAGMVDNASDWEKDVRKFPALWCETAAKRAEVAAPLAQAQAKAIVDDALATLDEFAKPEPKQIHVVAGSWYKDQYAPGYDKVKGVVWTTKTADLLLDGGKKFLAELDERMAGWKAVGATVPADLPETLAGKIAAAKTAIEAALPAPVFVAKAKDGAMEAAGKRGIEGKVLKSGVMTSQWIVTVNQANQKPLNRMKIGTIFYQKGPYCIYRSYVWKQYATNGRFDAGKIQDYSDWMMRCK